MRLRNPRNPLPRDLRVCRGKVLRHLAGRLSNDLQIPDDRIDRLFVAEEGFAAEPVRVALDLANRRGDVFDEKVGVALRHQPARLRYAARARA